MKKAHLAFVSAVVPVALLVGACSSSSSGSGSGGGSFTCDSKSKCPNEGAIDKAACEKIMSSSCGSQFKAYGDCVIANETCDDKGKSVDPPSCKSQQDAFAKCLQSSSDAGG
jgi:hypothetical protein